MLRWRDNNKRLLIAEDGKNDIANLVHKGTQSNHFGLALALCKVVLSQNGIVRSTFTGATNANKSHGMNRTPGKWRAALGHFNIGSIEFTRLLDSRVKTEVSKKLFGGFENGKIPNLAYHSNSREKAGALESFNQMNLLDEDFIRIGINELMHSGEYAIDFFIVFLDERDR